MGKKKRYIHRTRKFGTKAFRFLDRVDGTADSILSDAKIDNIIERIIVTDRGNQTIKLDARAIGADFSGQKITYTVNSLDADDILVDDSGSGRDKFTFPSAAPAVDGNDDVIVLAPGSHTVTAVISGPGAETAPLVTKSFNIARSEIVLDTSDDDFLVEGNTDGNIKVDLTKLVVTSGKQPGVEADYSPTETAAAGRHGYRLSVVDAAGTTVKVGADAGTDFLDVTDGNGLDEHDDLLRPLYVAGLAAGDYTYTVTFTPLGSDDAPLTADAVSKSVTITKNA